MTEVEKQRIELEGEIEYIKKFLINEGKPVDKIIAEAIEEVNRTWSALRDQYAQYDGEVDYKPFPVDDGRTVYRPVTRDDYPVKWGYVSGVVTVE